MGPAVLVLAADLTREEQRTKDMAIIGMTIGASFGLAVVINPVLNGWIGVRGMLWLTVVLAAFWYVVALFMQPPVAARADTPLPPPVSGS